MKDNAITERWMWMMEWCRERGMPPADSYVWSLAEDAYKKHKKNQKE